MKGQSVGGSRKERKRERERERERFTEWKWEAGKLLLIVSNNWTCLTEKETKRIESHWVYFFLAKWHLISVVQVWRWRRIPNTQTQSTKVTCSQVEVFLQSGSIALWTLLCSLFSSLLFSSLSLFLSSLSGFLPFILLSLIVFAERSQQWEKERERERKVSPLNENESPLPCASLNGKVECNIKCIYFQDAPVEILVVCLWNEFDLA